MILCRAYAELSTTRSIGMGIGPIPITAMWEWCARHNFDDEVTNHAVLILRIVDAETLHRAASKK